MLFQSFAKLVHASTFLNNVLTFLVNDALDDILADSDDEEEEAAIVNKVLDEIGIEISGQVSLLSNKVGIPIKGHLKSVNTSIAESQKVQTSLRIS